MLERPSIDSQRSIKYITDGVKTEVEGEDAVHDRRMRVPGFDQERLHAAKVLLIGAGGLGGEVGEGLVRKQERGRYPGDPRPGPCAGF